MTFCGFWRCCLTDLHAGGLSVAENSDFLAPVVRSCKREPLTVLNSIHFMSNLRFCANNDAIKMKFTT